MNIANGTYIGKRGNKVPPVLYDGNTVAWYDYNDPIVNVSKDGANRVNHWFDKFNYSVLANMVAGWSFLVGWVVTGVIDNATTFTTAIATRGIRKNGLVTIGKTYKIKFSKIGAGNVGLFSGAGIPYSFAPVDNTLYEFYFTALDADISFINYLWFGQTQITFFELQEVTGKHLIQQTGASQPLWSAANGILFDGVNDFMKATAFAFVQPEMIYFVGRQITWFLGDRFFDGTLLNGFVSQTNVANRYQSSSDNINYLASLNNIGLNTFGIIRTLFNGLNSSIQSNLLPVEVGNTGIGNMNGFTVGARGDGAGAWSNIEVKEIILRKSADSAIIQDQIYNYLKFQNGL